MVSKDILLKLIRGSKSKLTILKILQKEPSYVREISKEMQLFPSGIIKHLRFLEKRHLVTFEIVERKKYYKLTKKGKNLLKLL